MIEAKPEYKPVSPSTRRAPYRFVRTGALALMVSLGLGLAGCSSLVGTTYGTGETQEEALIKDVSGLFGAIPDEEKAPIDYSARAGLVLPPKDAPLPDPNDRARDVSSVASNWPNDPDKLRAAYHARVENMTEDERQQLLAQIRKLPPEQRDAIFKNDPRSTNFAGQIEEPDPINASADELAEYERQVQARKALIRLQNGDGAKGRKYLTQPPERFTDVSPEVREEMAKFEQEGERKEKTGLRRLWPF